MRHADVSQIVFSSTTATYGEPDVMPITESQRQDPINPYGFSKLVIERALADYARAYGWGYAAFRYFNAAGASPPSRDPLEIAVTPTLFIRTGEDQRIPAIRIC